MYPRDKLVAVSALAKSMASRFQSLELSYHAGIWLSLGASTEVLLMGLLWYYL